VTKLAGVSGNAAGVSGNTGNSGGLSENPGGLCGAVLFAEFLNSVEISARFRFIPGMAEHDPSYRLLFSHPRMVEDLLRGFVREDWTSRLDFSTLERVNGSFVSEDLKDRRNDVVWRVRWGDGEEEGWFYLYLLMEFQSSPEPFMAVRLLVYVGLLLQELIRAQGLTAADRLPPILPIVLYNGKRAWKAPLELASLFGPLPGGLRRHLPRLEYLLVDENRLSRAEKEQAGNLVAALVRLETSSDPDDLSSTARELSGLLPGEEHAELRRIFTAWTLRGMRRISKGATIPVIEDLSEVPMLEEMVLEWERKAVRRGRREGRLLGQRELVIRLLGRRFGGVPPEIRERIDAISSERELETLADRLMTARSLQEMGLG
jgi:predicted transposase/invertase (TIGR01784 family)